MGAITKEMITFAHSKEKKNEFDQYYRQIFVPRQQELERHNDEGEAMQRHVLATLLESANDTEYGRKHLST